MNAKNITDALTVVAALQPDIVLALTAYNVLHGIWSAVNPGKTEADYLAYLQAASQVNVDTTTSYLKAQGYVENPPGSGSWSKP